MVADDSERFSLKILDERSKTLIKVYKNVSEQRSMSNEDFKYTN